MLKLALLYTFFALIAMAANIAAQDQLIRYYQGPYDVTLSVMVGTGAGLVVKYLLDKRYIFRFRASGLAHDGWTFILYSIMGLATTLIFWGFEFGFNYHFHTKTMRYVGGLIGLAIGYLIKYQLDRRFVFRTAPPEKPATRRQKIQT